MSARKYGSERETWAAESYLFNDQGIQSIQTTLDNALADGTVIFEQGKMAAEYFLAQKKHQTFRANRALGRREQLPKLSRDMKKLLFKSEVL